MSELEKEIASAINRVSAENGSDTPDFILAAYLSDCLTAFNRAFRWREKWYSPYGVPAKEWHAGPQPPYGNLKIADPPAALPAPERQP